MKNTFIVLLCAVAVLLSTYATIESKKKAEQKLGYGQFTPTITVTSVNCGGSISGATTSLWAAGTNYQYVYLVNTGQGNVNWAFGSTNAATGTAGRVLYPVGSSTAFSALEIRDVNLLGKGANCTGNPTSTVSITAY